MLKLEHVTRRFKTKGRIVNAVDDISLEFHKGEFVSILGLSGSGKTTLVSLIGGLDRPTEGKLSINGVDTSEYNQQDWANYRLNNIGFVFQDFNLINHLTAKENIEIALSLSGYTVEEKSVRANELLTLMGLSERWNQLPTQLSGGEKQRVAIARALANRPEIILADEPTGALDPDTSVQIMTILKDLAHQGHLVIMVTHNQYLAKDYSTRIVELDQGKVINERQLGDYNDYKEDSAPIKRSSLELSAAYKIAYNNLKLRKKSTLFSLVSLVPSMVLIFALVNFIFNLSAYQEDFRPITSSVLNDPTSLYISPYTDDQLDAQVKKVYKNITDRRYEEVAVDRYKTTLVTPFSLETIKEIEAIEGVETVLAPTMFNVVIDHHNFVMVTLPPKAYSNRQYVIDEAYYPEDKDEGLILSTEAAKVLMGKYSHELEKLKGTSLAMDIWGVNGIGLGREVYEEKRHQTQITVAEIIDVQAKTTLVKNYYSGYIFVSNGYGEQLKASFAPEDFTFISTTPKDPMDPRPEEIIVLGPMYMTDLLKPLREKTMLQDNYDLFSFREFSYVMPSNNFGIKHLVVTNEDFNEASRLALESYGNLYDSAFDEATYASAQDTSKYIQYTLLGASFFALLVILIPSLLVCVILYISILLRVKEIGILKSIGARNSDILGIFTIEAGLVAVVGTLTGMVLSLPLIAFLRNTLEQQYRITYYLGSNPMSYNLWGLLTAGVFAMLLVTMFGLMPGRKASQLQPNVLLKHIN